MDLCTQQRVILSADIEIVWCMYFRENYYIAQIINVFEIFM
jgi:hypothetical protein